MVRRTVLAALQLLSLRSVVIVRAAHSTAHVISSAYNPVPPQLALRNVVVIHRHGDRSQISREIGPAYPEDPKVEAIWTAAMPTHDTLYAMGGAAAPPDEFLQSGSKDVKDAVYTGWDRQNTPYGQLTDLGAQQLMSIGAELRRRYVGTLLPADAGDAASLLYCRSTNFCRTMQSLRALLAGLLNVGASAFPPAPGARLPTILSRPKAKETMFPTADGPCPRMTERRADVFPPTLYHAKLPFYPALEAHMKETLGYTDKVSWVTVKVRACVVVLPRRHCTPRAHHHGRAIAGDPHVLRGARDPVPPGRERRRRGPRDGAGRVDVGRAVQGRRTQPLRHRTLPAGTARRAGRFCAAQGAHLRSICP